MERLLELSALPCFTGQQLAAQLSISSGSAAVFASRHAKTGLLLKLKNNYYTLAQRWRTATDSELLGVANILQVPSYVSLTTALAHYELTTQVQRGFIESVCLKRTASYEAGGVTFSYRKIDREHYSGFVRKDGVFIATPEKAFLDCVYLFSFGKYKPDFGSMDLTRLDPVGLKKLMRGYPPKSVKIARKLCGI